MFNLTYECALQACLIHPSSVNSRRREESAPQDERGGYRPEKRIYAYQEAVFVANPGGKADSGSVLLRNVTRLDGLNYLLFAAYHLQPVSSGLRESCQSHSTVPELTLIYILVCDDWLPIAGRLDQLDDIQRLRTIFDNCMLRVFEGLYHLGLPLRRFPIPDKPRRNAPPPVEDQDRDWDGQEHESDDESSDEDDVGPTAETRRTPARPRTWPGRLTSQEVEETNGLMAEVVRILDMYAAEREPAISRNITRPSTPGW